MRKLCVFAAAAAVGVLLGACALFGPGELADTYTVHKVYGDHMVLQRQRPIRISGTAAPGRAVKVTIGENSAYGTANADGECHPNCTPSFVAVAYGTANADGEWVAELPAMEAGGPFEVTVSAGEGAPVTKFSDVLIGEVWLCSGQSNMEMQVRKANNAQVEIAAANHPRIRLFNTVARRSMAPAGPVAEIAGPGWVVCSPETVGPFSALGYFFGRQLGKDLNVPVGLINSSWSGTPIQSWISAEGYRLAGRERELLQIDSAGKSKAEIAAVQRTLKEKSAQDFAAWLKRFLTSNPDADQIAQTWPKIDFNDSAWQDAPVPGEIDGNIDGVVWYRRTVNIPADWAGRELTLSLGAVDDCDETYFNGKKVGAVGTETPMYWSVKRNYRIPAELVRAGNNVIAVRVIDLFSSGGITGPEISIAPQDSPSSAINLAGRWKSKLEFKADLDKIGLRPITPDEIKIDLTSRNFPATLFNSMIAPWTVYPIRGILWYQGESNANLYTEYMKLHPLLINDWRRHWRNPEMPFIFVQLTAFERNSPNARLPEDFWVGRAPSDGAWPRLREIQAATLKVPNTGMVVSIDVGDAFDLHPRDKQTLGYRAAKEAERIVFHGNPASTGPLYDAMKIEGDKIRISFRNVGQGLVAKGGAPATFAIAGTDGKFVWADAKIDGDTILVWSDKVREPVAVRYAWSGWPGNANLFNRDGFPASPFRTDQPDYLLK